MIIVWCFFLFLFHLTTFLLKTSGSINYILTSRAKWMRKNRATTSQFNYRHREGFSILCWNVYIKIVLLIVDITSSHGKGWRTCCDMIMLSLRNWMLGTSKQLQKWLAIFNSHLPNICHSLLLILCNDLRWTMLLVNDAIVWHKHNRSMCSCPFPRSRSITNRVVAAHKT